MKRTPSSQTHATSSWRHFFMSYRASITAGFFTTAFFSAAYVMKSQDQNKPTFGKISLPTSLSSFLPSSNSNTVLSDLDRKLAQLNRYEENVFFELYSLGVTIDDFLRHKGVLDSLVAERACVSLFKLKKESTKYDISFLPATTFDQVMEDIVAIKQCSNPEARLRETSHGLPVCYAKSLNDAQIQLYGTIRECGEFTLTPQDIAQLHVANDCGYHLYPIVKHQYITKNRSWPEVVALINNVPRSTDPLNFGSDSFEKRRRNHIDVLSSLKWRESICQQTNYPINTLGDEFSWIQSKEVADAIVSLIKGLKLTPGSAAHAIRQFSNTQLLAITAGFDLQNVSKMTESQAGILHDAPRGSITPTQVLQLPLEGTILPDGSAATARDVAVQLLEDGYSAEQIKEIFNTRPQVEISGVIYQGGSVSDARDYKLLRVLYPINKPGAEQKQQQTLKM